VRRVARGGRLLLHLGGDLDDLPYLAVSEVAARSGSWGMDRI